MPLPNCTDKIDDLIWSDGAHDAKLERRMPEPGEIPCLALGLLHLAVNLLQMRADDPAQFRQVGVGPLPMEKRTSELLLQLPDRSRQRGLVHMTAFRRLGKVQVLA